MEEAKHRGATVTRRHGEGVVGAGETGADLDGVDHLRSFLEPWSLLSLKEQASHGHELVGRIHAVGIETSSAVCTGTWPI